MRLDPPRLSQLVETFIAIPIAPGVPAVAVWQDYLDLLRKEVVPLRARLIRQKKIGWFGFLIHNRASGVPTAPSDNGNYIHLRLSPKAGVTPAMLMALLPPSCKMTRRVQQPVPNTMDSMDVSSLKRQSVRHAWHLLGEASEWTLRILEAHTAGKPVPVQNVAQLLHYLGNGLFTSVVGVPMP